MEGVVPHFKKLGASEDDLEKIREQQIDGAALSVMSQDELKTFVSAIGARLRHKTFLGKDLEAQGLLTPEEDDNIEMVESGEGSQVIMFHSCF